MTVKLFEILDRHTCIPAIGIECLARLGTYDGEYQLLRRAGYNDKRCILFGKLTGGDFAYDPFNWPGRTMGAAHKYITDNWAILESGDIIDVEYILGETVTKKETDLP